jgi:hypothetical protein
MRALGIQISAPIQLSKSMVRQRDFPSLDRGLLATVFRLLDSNGIEWAYLLLYECTVHLTEKVKEALTRNNTEIMTSFIVAILRCCNRWMPVTMDRLKVI